MTKLIAEELMDDPRVQEGKKLILSAMKEHQEKLHQIQGPHSALKDAYQGRLDTFAENRGGKLWYPYIGSGIGKGVLVELADGSVKYDLICGIGPHYWGHSHPDIIEAEISASMSDLVMQGHLQQNSDSEVLCELLTKASGKDHCFLSSTGVMANENALKMAFQKKHPADRVLAFSECFAGRTLAVSQITDKAKYRAGLPSTLAVDYVPFYDYRDPEGSTQRAVQVLREHLERHPGKYAAMIMELVQGEAGFYPGSRDFFMSLIHLLKEHEVAIIDDEVQVFGRTSSLFAFQYFGLEDYVDFVCIGKLSQVCATLYNSEFKPKPGLLSQTFLGSTSALKAAKVIISGLLEGDYLGENGRIMQVHKLFTQEFESIAQRQPGLLSGPFGIGSMVAFTPLDGSAATAAKVSQKLYDNGVISFVCGNNPMRIRFLVPVGAITDKDIGDVCKIVEQTLVECRDEAMIVSS